MTAQSPSERRKKLNSKKSIKSAIESMMYVWGEPLDIRMIAETCNVSKEDAENYLLELQSEYEQEARGIIIRRVGKGYQFVTRPENAPFIEKLCTPVKVKKLSQSALEVLAIIAYKQPVAKSEIDAIRGIKCDRVIEGLKNKDLICEKGRSEGVGRPILYGTTDMFLKQFGFESLSQMPEINDLASIVTDSEDVYEGQISIEDVGKEVENE